MDQDLPPGWVCHRDAVVCLPVVYQNVHTGEVRYDKQCGEDKLAQKLPKRVLDAEYERRLAAGDHGPPPENEGPRVRDWEVIEDAQEVLTCFYEHAQSDLTCYDRPRSHEEIARCLSNQALNKEFGRRQR